MRKRLIALTAAAGLAAAALLVIGTAGAESPKQSATPVFKLLLKPSQEVPRIKDLRADAVGFVSFDLERNAAGTITSGEAVFYFNYKFPGSTTIVGLHVHQGNKGVNGPIVIDSGTTAFTDADGKGNITKVVEGVSPALLQAILDNPRGYYANLHTSVHPGGAIRDQLHNPKKR